MPTLQRRELLATGGRGLAAASLLAIAGCSGDGDGGEDGGDGSDGDSDGGDGGSTDSGGPEQEEMGGVAENTVSGLEIVGYVSDASGSRFSVEVTIDNVGDRDVDLMDYTYEVAIFADGDELPTDSTSREGSETAVAAGERGTLTLKPRYAGDLSEIDEYEIALSCPTMASATYC